MHILGDLLLKDRSNTVTKYMLLFFNAAAGQNVGQRQSPKVPPAWWTEGE